MCPLGLVAYNLFPGGGSVIEKAVERALPSPDTQPTAMQLIPTVLVSNSLNPLPVPELQDLIRVHATYVASPLEN